MTDTELLLLRYSEWLDEKDIMKSPDESGDNRTHEELVRDFVSYAIEQYHAERAELA